MRNGHPDSTHNGSWSDRVDMAPFAPRGNAADSPAGPQFLDTPTAEVLGLDEVWRLLEPVTAAGRRAKAALQPYLPGQESAWEAALEQLRTDLDQWDDTLCERLEAALRGLPDIEEALSWVDLPGARPTVHQVLLLKQYAWWIARWDDDPILRPWLGPLPPLARRLLERFGRPAEPAFALDDVAGLDYRQAAADYARTMAALAAAAKARDAAWQRRTGVRPRTNGRLIIPLPDGAELAAQLKRESGIRWVHDAPGESVFELEPTEDMLSLAQQQASLARRVRELEQIELARLGEAVTADAGSWYALKHAVANLDLRLARVRLARCWCGMAPAAGETIRLVGGVHPLVRAPRFAPVTMQVGAGVTVIVGPNMSGKTVAMALCALCQVLAQYALPVPARRFETRLLAVVRMCAGGQTEMAQGLSAFGSEMTRWQSVWEDLQAAGQALVLVDEPAQTTDPVAGEALAAGLVRALMEHQPRAAVLIATHYAALTRLPGVQALRVYRPSHEPDGTLILEPLAEGGAGSEALHVAARMGLAKEILNWSWHHLDGGQMISLETNGTGGGGYDGGCVIHGQAPPRPLEN